MKQIRLYWGLDKKQLIDAVWDVLNEQIDLHKEFGVRYRLSCEIRNDIVMPTPEEDGSYRFVQTNSIGHYKFRREMKYWIENLLSIETDTTKHIFNH